MRVAAYQMPVGTDVASNARLIAGALHAAAAAGAGILLTPEGSLSGYTHEFNAPDVRLELKGLEALASELEIGLALGTCFVEPDGQTYNQLRFSRPDGTYLGFHSKILRCGTLDVPSQGEINNYATTPLRTFDLGGVTIGGLICNDLWANPQCTPMDDPHLVTQLGKAGAQVIFHCAYGGRDGGEWSRMVWDFHETNLRMRAAAAGVWIVTVDCATPEQLPCSAPSGVVAPDGAWVARAPESGAHLLIADLQL